MRAPEKGELKRCHRHTMQPENIPIYPAYPFFASVMYFPSQVLYTIAHQMTKKLKFLQLYKEIKLHVCASNFIQTSVKCFYNLIGVKRGKMC